MAKAKNKSASAASVQKQMAEDLAQTSLQLEAVLDAIPDIIGVMTPDHRMLRYNQAGYAFLKHSPDDIKGTLCYELIGRREPCEPCPAEEALRTGKPARKEVYDEQNKIWFDVRAYPVYDNSGTIRFIIQHLRDVTRNRQIDQLKSDFISTAAHELRTPLAAVTGFSELLLARGDLSVDEQREFLSYIHDKSWELTRIVESLLDISRAESNKPPPLNPFPCRVGDLVRQVEPLLKTLARGHSWRFDLEEEDLELIIDRRRMAQVLENIVSNAIKYSPGGGMIEIRGQKRLDDYLFEVRDEGIGMTQDQIEQIFDKFYRADSSNAGISGIGLGMTIARAIVLAHGGDIWVESRPAQGTRVFFALPLEFPRLMNNH